MSTTGRRTTSWQSVLSAFLVFFMTGSGIVFARAEKRGAMLVVQKKDGRIVRGELLAVRNGTLNLLLYENAAKVDVRLEELRHLRIEKKGSFLKSFGAGLLAGAATGALIGFLSGDDDPGFMSFSAGQKALVLGIVLGGGGGVIGGISGALKGTDESVDLEMLAPEKMTRVEAKLASRARYKPLPSAGPENVPLPEPRATLSQVSGVSLPGPPALAPDEKPRSALSSQKVPCRWHFSVVWGKSISAGADKLASVIEKAGFGDDEYHEAYWIISSYTTMYPTQDTGPKFSWKDFRAEYSLTHALAVGLAVAPLGAHAIWGWRRMERIKGFWGMNEVGPYFGGRFRGNAYYLTAAFMPIPDMFLRKSMFTLGGGIGFSTIKGTLISALDIPYSEEEENIPGLEADKIDFSRVGVALLAFAEIAHFFGRHLSFGLRASYKYAPFHTKAGTLEIPYVHASSDLLEVLTVNAPRTLINAGGFGAGVSLGLHF